MLLLCVAVFVSRNPPNFLDCDRLCCLRSQAPVLSLLVSCLSLCLSLTLVCGMCDVCACLKLIEISSALLNQSPVQVIKQSTASRADAASTGFTRLHRHLSLSLSSPLASTLASTLASPALTACNSCLAYLLSNMPTDMKTRLTCIPQLLISVSPLSMVLLLLLLLMMSAVTDSFPKILVQVWQ